MKVFKYIGLLTVLAVVAGGAWLGWQIYRGQELDETSRAFVEQGLPKLAQERWYGPHMRPLAHSKFMDAVSMEEWHNLSTYYYKHLGDLKEFGDCDGQAMLNYNNGERLLSADYTCDATFQKGTAMIEVKLLPETNDTDWKIIHLNVKSEAFMR